MLISPAYAQDVAGLLGPATQFLPLVLIFGVFYTALAFLGLFVHYPFGLHLGPGENVFHFLVGPAALVVGWRAR